jgi:hypothetical protein
MSSGGAPAWKAEEEGAARAADDAAAAHERPADQRLAQAASPAGRWRLARTEASALMDDATCMALRAAGPLRSDED